MVNGPVAARGSKSLSGLTCDPVLVGGKRLVLDDRALRTLRLVERQVTTKGAILATYTPVEA